jgi:hypothetical protein
MPTDTELYSKIIKNISTIKNIEDIQDAFWNSFYTNKNIPNNNLGSKLKILLLNTPCNGFGDIVFAMKIADYLEEWYNAKVTIASTSIESFKKLGRTNNLVSLVSKNKNAQQCRRFKLLKLEKNIPEQDMIFVAPMQSDYDPSLVDVRYLIPYATKINTFFFSEYNHDGNTFFEFDTGVGKDKCGMLFTKPAKVQRSPKLKNPYALIYIAESVDNSDTCFFSFIEMVCAKYHKQHKNFDIVIPTSIEYFLSEYENKLIKKVGKYYPNIKCVTKDNEEYYILEDDSSKNTLTFRLDILPVSNKEMFGIMDHSVKDILLTGDQSITDALSCCGSKNIFYQIAPWKITFGHELAKYLPNKYLKSVKTSCGTIKAIRYNSDYRNFIKKWDFKVLAKPKLDAIIKFFKFRNENKKLITELEDIISSSRNMKSLMNKLSM